MAQNRLAACTKIDRVEVTCIIPSPSTVGVVYGIPLGDDNISKLKVSIPNAIAILSTHMCMRPLCP